MRALVVLTFLVVAAALVFSIMAFTRINTTLSVAMESADKVAKLEQKSADQQGEVQRQIQAEAGALKAALETRISGIAGEVKKLSETAPNEPVIKAQVKDSLNQVGKQFMDLSKTVTDLQTKLAEKDAKIAELEKKLSAESAELRGMIVELTRLVRGFISIISPAEKDQPEPSAQPEISPQPVTAEPVVTEDIPVVVE